MDSLQSPGDWSTPYPLWIAQTTHTQKATSAMATTSSQPGMVASLVHDRQRNAHHQARPVADEAPSEPTEYPGGVIWNSRNEKAPHMAGLNILRRSCYQ